MTEGKIVEQVTEFNYLRHKISEYKKDTAYELQTHTRIIGIIKNFGKQTSIQTKLRTHNMTKKSLEDGSETWVLNKGDKQQLGAA